jgi:hypothetical protein
VEDIWGLEVPSITAPLPADTTLLSPASNGTTQLYRDPVLAAGGTATFLGWGVHGTSANESSVSATATAPKACGGATANPTPTPTPTATATPDATASPSPTPAPTVNPVPTPPAQVTPVPKKLPRFAAFVGLPSAKRCTTAKKLRIKLRSPAGFPVRSIAYRVKGKRAKTRRKGSVVRLRRVPAGRFKLAVTVKLEDGRTVKGSRRYRTCKR